MNLRINDLSGNVVVPQHCKVNDRLPAASLIRGSQTQCGAGHAVKLLKHLDLLPHFLSVTRHRRFEDVQAVVDLISDARQISSLLISSSLHNLFVHLLFQLGDVRILSCNPFVSARSTVQGVQAQAILRCNEASSLTTNEVFLDSFPVYVQGLTHSRSLYAPSCNSQGIPDSRNHRIATTRS